MVCRCAAFMMPMFRADLNPRLLSLPYTHSAPQSVDAGLGPPSVPLLCKGERKGDQ